MITLKDCHIGNCGVGISTDGTIDIDISGTKIVGCKTAIEHRDQPGTLQALGLPENTPLNLLIEALELLLNNQDSGPNESAKVLSQSTLFQWLGNAANAASILANLISLQQSGWVQSFLNMLSRQT